LYYGSHLFINYSYTAEKNEAKNSDAFFWIGLNCLGITRKYFWVATGEELGDFKYWSPKQPDNSKSTELCIEYLYRDAQKPMWNDRHCLASGRFICEVRNNCKTNSATIK
jgi:hypothetical protein